MNMLTVRKLPIWQTPASENLKYRIDRSLVRLVHDAICLQNPRLKIGKRFAIEYALTQWLHSEGLLRERVNVPEMTGDSNGNHE